MTEYINTTTLLKEIDYAFHTDTIGKKDVINLIINLPVADVAPVRHGSWRRIEDDIYKCDNCGELCYVEEIKGKPVWKYCPYCGAKMD